MPGYFSPQLRRRLAPLLLVVGALLFGKIAHDEVPKDQLVRYSLTPAQQSTAEAVRVTYSTDGDVLSGLEQHFPSGAPAEFTAPTLPQTWTIQVSINLIGRDGRVSRLERALEVPSEVTPRISLSEAR